MAYATYSSRRPTNESSIGGISAVNPQSKGDVNKYIDASYTQAKNRLDPIFQQQNATYEQSMVDRGIPVGGEAYNKASRQLGQTQNDAYSQAAFNAMGFGAGLQAQDFGQDATRSQLANALLSQKWGTDLGYYVNDANTGLGYAGLNENARQADNNLGYNYAGLDYNYAGLDYNYANLGENARQFDSTQDYNYWDRGNQFDYMWDRADQGDMQWMSEFDRNIWNDQNNLNQWSDYLSNGMLEPFDPNIPNVGAAIVGAQDSNLSLYDKRRDANKDWWGQLGNIPWGDVFRRNQGSAGGSGPSGPPQ